MTEHYGKGVFTKKDIYEEETTGEIRTIADRFAEAVYAYHEAEGELEVVKRAIEGKERDIRGRLLEIAKFAFPKGVKIDFVHIWVGDKFYTIKRDGDTCAVFPCPLEELKMKIQPPVLAGPNGEVYFQPADAGNLNIELRKIPQFHEGATDGGPLYLCLIVGDLVVSSIDKTTLNNWLNGYST